MLFNSSERGWISNEDGGYNGNYYLHIGKRYIILSPHSFNKESTTFIMRMNEGGEFGAHWNGDVGGVLLFLQKLCYYKLQLQIVLRK